MASRQGGKRCHLRPGVEHDGAEPDEDYEPSADFDTGEPSLGWTVDGMSFRICWQRGIEGRHQ